MKIEIYVTQSMQEPLKCNVDVAFLEIPVIGQMHQRVDGCPFPLNYGYLLACTVAKHIKEYAPVRIGIDECLKKQMDEEDKLFVVQ